MKEIRAYVGTMMIMASVVYTILGILPIWSIILTLFIAIIFNIKR